MTISDVSALGRDTRPAIAAASVSRMILRLAQPHGLSRRDRVLWLLSTLDDHGDGSGHGRYEREIEA